jgi:predicted small integral membrane protein
MQKYASFSHRISPEFSSGDQPFCSRCIANQGQLRELFANYLPDPSDPNYAKREAGFDKYRAQMEKDYPPVCAKCVHRVNQQIEKVTRATRADNLRRHMDSQRAAQLLSPSGWRMMLIRLGGLAWWASLLGQLQWHVFGAIQKVDPNADDATYISCLSSALKSRAVESYCVHLATAHLQLFLLLGAISIWWNNRLREKLFSRGKLINITDYTVLQLTVLGVRLASVWLLSDTNGFTLPIPLEAGHLFMLLFLAIVSFRVLSPFCIDN